MGASRGETAVLFARRGEERSFLSVDAHYKRGRWDNGQQRQRRPAGERQPDPDEHQDHAGIGRMAYPAVGATVNHRLPRLDPDVRYPHGNEVQQQAHYGHPEQVFTYALARAVT